MSLAVPVTYQNPYFSYLDINKLLVKNDIRKLNIAFNMRNELGLPQLTVAPSTQKPNNHFNSSIATIDTISLFNSITTELGTAEVRPSQEHYNFPYAANETFPLINSSTLSREAGEDMSSEQNVETSIGASNRLPSDGTNDNESAFYQERSESTEKLKVVMWLQINR